MRLPVTTIAILVLMVDAEMQMKGLSYVEEQLNLLRPKNTWSLYLQDLLGLSLLSILHA